MWTELYRWELGLTVSKVFRQGSFGWRIDNFKGSVRESEFGTSDGRRKRVRAVPRAAARPIIILTSSPTANTRGDRGPDRAGDFLVPPGSTKRNAAALASAVPEVLAGTVGASKCSAMGGAAQ